MSQVKKISKKIPTAKQRWEYIGLAVAAVLIAIYLTLWRAIDTGSWWEYSYTFVLLLFALNRLIAAVSGLGHRR